MTDPLSISVSVLTLIGITAKVVKGLSGLREIGEAGAEILALDNEVSFHLLKSTMETTAFDHRYRCFRG